MLVNMYPNYSRQKMQEVQNAAIRASQRKSDSTRHKCFVSYHVADLDEVKAFVESFGEEFIPVTVGVTDEDTIINSTDEDYIKAKIREDYLSDSTVTIVLLGENTWGRKYVDWEISATLRNDPVNKRSGLLVIPLPSMQNSANLPARARDNWIQDDEDNSYTLYKSYPLYNFTLRSYIEDAYKARTSKSHLVDNSRPLRQRNASE